MKSDPCHFEPVEINDHANPRGGRRVCTGAGNLLACQLCRNSPTYAVQAFDGNASAWDGTRKPGDNGTVTAEETQAVTLNWSTHGPLGAATWINPPRPCVQCGKPSHLASPGRKRNPLHKTCAERWIAEHPKHAERHSHDAPDTL